MMIMLIGGVGDGEIITVQDAKEEVRVKLPSGVVESYAVDPISVSTDFRHKRGVAHYVGDKETAESLIDAVLTDA